LTVLHWYGAKKKERREGKPPGEGIADLDLKKLDEGKTVKGFQKWVCHDDKGEKAPLRRL